MGLSHLINVSSDPHGFQPGQHLSSPELPFSQPDHAGSAYVKLLSRPRLTDVIHTETF
jgi:hypothetical protein